MKTLLAFGLALVLCLPALGAGVPNLVGNWTRTDFEGIVYGNPLEQTTADTPGNFTWLHENTTPGVAMFTINEQRGNAFKGTYMTNPANKSTYEILVGIIGYDNNSINIGYGDNVIQGKLLSPSEMEATMTEIDSHGLVWTNLRFSKTK